MIAAVQGEIDIGINGVVAIRLETSSSFTTISPERGGSGNLKSTCLCFGKDDELALDLLDAPHAFLSLCGLRGLVAKLIYKDLHVGDLAFLCGALGLICSRLSSRCLR